MQIPEAVLRHQGFPVNAYTANGLGYPRGITAEQFIIVGSTQVANQTQLDDELVNQFLGFFFGDHPIDQIALDINIQEGRRTAQGRGRAVIFFRTGQIRHIDSLYRVMGRNRRFRNIHTVRSRHGGNVTQGANLHAHFFAQADTFFIHGPIQFFKVQLFLFNQKIGTVQSYPAVIANNAAAAVCIRQPGKQPGMTGLSYPRGICIKDPVVVSLAVFGKMTANFRVQFITVCLQALFRHTHATVQVHHTL